MKIIHTADLHIGQIIYQHYDRADEHLHFFSQLERMVAEEQPDALIVAGDIFDVPQASASSWRMFTEAFVRIRKENPRTAIIIVAGNHDSASRLHSHRDVWGLSDTVIVGTPPPLSLNNQEGWEEQYVVRLQSGYIIALPYMNSEKTDAALLLQEYVAKENVGGLPVVMTGHLPVNGCDPTGHDREIGMLRAVNLEKFGDGYDYLALGHIHRPQTLTHPGARSEEPLATPVARYSGSALHVSCDEAYPHTVSVVEIDRHKGSVTIRERRIDQLRHFYNLPLKSSRKDEEPAFSSEEETVKELERFIASAESCYIRLKVGKDVNLSSDFTNRVYRLIEESGKDIRYNPKIIWVGEEDAPKAEEKEQEIAVEELQQMTNPLEFIRLTSERYPRLDMKVVEAAFKEIEQEVQEMKQSKAKK